MKTLTVSLKPTKKAKELFRQFGNKWIILKDDFFKGSPAFLVSSMDGKDKRWILKEFDPNFEILCYGTESI